MQVDVQAAKVTVGGGSNFPIVLGLGILSGLAIWVTYEKRKRDQVSLTVQKTNIDFSDVPGYLSYNVPQVVTKTAPLYNPSEPHNYRLIPADKPKNANFKGTFGGVWNA